MINPGFKTSSALEAVKEIVIFKAMPSNWKGLPPVLPKIPWYSIKIVMFKFILSVFLIYSLCVSLFHFIMNFNVKYRPFNLITLGREWGGGELEVTFSLIPVKLFNKEVLAECERNSVSFQGIPISSQSNIYKRTERTRGSTVRSQKGILRDLQIILLYSFVRSKTFGLEWKTLSVSWVCSCYDWDCYKFFLCGLLASFVTYLTCWTDPSVLYEIELQTVLCSFNFQASLLRTGM